MKKCYASYIIKKWKKSRSEDEIELIDSTEEPLSLDHGISDSLSIFGTNKEGYSLFITFTRKPHRVSDVILVLTLPCGTRLQLPSEYLDFILNNGF